ncbi:hypothetical protein RUM43_009553, partial [Polyplax serrata]
VSLGKVASFEKKGAKAKKKGRKLECGLERPVKTAWRMTIELELALISCLEAFIFNRQLQPSDRENKKITSDKIQFL